MQQENRVSMSACVSVREKDKGPTFYVRACACATLLCVCLHKTHTHALSARSKLEANWGIGLLAYFRTGQLSKSVQPPWNSYYSHGGRTYAAYRITAMFFHTGEENRSDRFPNTEDSILFKTQRVWRQKKIFLNMLISLRQLNGEGWWI